MAKATEKEKEYSEIMGVYAKSASGQENLKTCRTGMQDCISAVLAHIGVEDEYMRTHYGKVTD